MPAPSAEAIKAALPRISAAPQRLKPNLKAHAPPPTPNPTRAKILQIAEGAAVPAAEISELNFRLGHLFAEAAIAACKKLRVPLKSVDLIASHGQTISHQGEPVSFLAAPTSSTMHIGDHSIIAA